MEKILRTLNFKYNTVILLIVAIIGIFVLYCKNSNYKITYYDNGMPGSTSEIKISNSEVEIITTNFCGTLDCYGESPKTEKKVYKYSKENMIKLKKFFRNNFLIYKILGLKNKNIELNEDYLNEYQSRVMQGLVLGESFFEVSIEKFRYKIEYSKTDSLNYIIYFKDNKTILVKKLNINGNDDITKIDTYKLKFSKKNLNIINDYIKKEVKKENSKVISKTSSLKKDEINIIKSIIDNNESYLD